MSVWRRVGVFIALGALVVGATAWVRPASWSAGSAASSHRPPRSDVNRGPVAPLGESGRWLVDAEGRVVTLHGINEVEKSAPYYPAAGGFDEDDVQFLADNGFTTVRLGVVVGGLMPEPGVVDHAYIENLAQTVELLARHRIFVLLDFHQDGYGPKYNGNGFPDWMGIDDGLPNPPAQFPLYYVQNPAMQRAFESFWQNRPAVDGRGLQDHFVDGLVAVVRRFRRQPYVLGYELMNEPWPGATWEPCLVPPDGCAATEQELLVPFHRKATAAVRALTRTQPVYVEPFVLFNFGQAGTSLPGARSRNVLSFHSYALDVAGEQAVVDNAVAAAVRDGRPLVATEFGATTDAPTLQRLTGQLDGGLLSWMYWSYDDLAGAGGDAALGALARPYPLAVAGTPASTTFDPATRGYDLAYSTRGPDGRRYRGRVDTVVSVPELQYPDGYTVSVSGARVTSSPCAPLLTLRTRSGRTSEVRVHITPGGSCR
jgi:endoglycosylceramidase